MVRWSYVVIALLGMTGLALAQPPPQLSQQPQPEPAAAPAEPGIAAPAPQSKVGGDLAFVLPLGDYADGVNAAFGLFGRFEFGLSSQLFATGRLGFLYHLVDSDPDGDFSLTMIPIYGGIRYNLEPTGGGLFLLGELGLNIVRVSVSFLGTEISDTDTNVSLNLGAGFQTGALNFKGTLFITPGVGSTSGDGGTTLVGLMAAVGFDFAAL